jgi:hypothetical protein
MIMPEKRPCDEDIATPEEQAKLGDQKPTVGEGEEEVDEETE